MAAGDRRRALVGLIVAVTGAAYPVLFHRIAALGVGPYGGIAPIEWDRTLLMWATALATILVIAAVMSRFGERRFLDVLVPATAVMWAVAFGWRIVLWLSRTVPVPAQLIVASVFVAIVAGGWLLLRVSRTPEGASALTLAVAVPLVLLAWDARALVELPITDPNVVTPQTAAASDRPSVWILVFDALPSPAALDTLGWQSSDLVESFEREGFVVADEALAYTTGTYSTLGSMLTLAAEPPSPPVTPDEQAEWLAVMDGSHPLAASLVDDGYDYVMVDNGWSWTSCGTLVTDCRVRPMISELEWTVLINTLAEPTASLHGPWRTHSLVQMNELRELAVEPATSPRLVYAHLLIPHQPYELDADCSLRRATPSVPESSWLRTEDGFRTQMTCTAGLLVELIEAIPADDIVLVVGDHGSDLANKSGGGYDPAELRDRATTFVAVRGCGLTGEDLTSNVNAYRAVATCVTTGDYPPWPSQAFLACARLDGIVGLVEATEALQTGTGKSCDDG